MSDANCYSSYDAMEDADDPVIAGVAAARAAALRAGDTGLARRLEPELDRLTDPALDLLRTADKVCLEIDVVRYDCGHALAGIKTMGSVVPIRAPGYESHATGNVDEWLAHVASRLTGATNAYKIAAAAS